jgi:hypothetical protein
MMYRMHSVVFLTSTWFRICGLPILSVKASPNCFLTVSSRNAVGFGRDSCLSKPEALKLCRNAVCVNERVGGLSIHDCMVLAE